MQIKCVNNSTSPIVMPGDVTVAAGATKTVTSRTRAEAEAFQQSKSSATVIVELTLETAELEPLVCTMKTPSDPGSGVGTLAACGFDLEDLEGNAFADQSPMHIAVFDDAALTVPSVNGTLDTAANGTIDAGAGTNSLEVTPDAAGIFSVTLTQSDDIQCWVKAWQMSSVARPIDCSSVHAPTFIP
jgi:hypothetical protein